jgi:hypothetical protein
MKACFAADSKTHVVVLSQKLALLLQCPGLVDVAFFAVAKLEEKDRTQVSQKP